MTIQVLFICCDNAARSQMAEHLLNQFGHGQFIARSAGTNPQPVDPMAIETLKEMHIDASTAQSHHIIEYASEHFDYVINVCDQTRSTCDFSCSDSCPSFPGYDKRICWSFQDVLHAKVSDEEKGREFRRVRNEIANRLRIWIPAIEKHHSRELSN